VRKIEAIVRTDKLDALREAFLEAGIQIMTVTEVRDYGNNKSYTEIYRNNVFSNDSLARVKVETIVPQNKVSTVASILKTIGQTGIGGEERILISSVNDISQMHSSESGNPFDESRA